MRGAGRLAVALLLAASPSAAGDDVLVIFDASGSMGSGAEIQPAKDALAEVLDEIETPGTRWGLRLYGTGCCVPDTHLEVPLSVHGLEEVRRRLPAIEGRSSSPMAEALAAARRIDWAHRSLLERRQAIVVSDGLVDRQAACREARGLRQDGVAVTVIGLEFAGVAEGHETLRYVAEHPDCAFGRYVRTDRAGAAAAALARVARTFHALPYRWVALVLALIATHHTVRFVEIALERRTRLAKHLIPPLCRGLLLASGLVAAIGLLGLGGLLVLALGVAVVSAVLGILVPAVVRRSPS